MNGGLLVVGTIAQAAEKIDGILQCKTNPKKIKFHYLFLRKGSNVQLTSTNHEE